MNSLKEPNGDGKQKSTITMKFQTQPIWVIPVQWTKLCAVIETHGSTYKAFNTFRKLRNDKTSHVKGLPLEIVEMILVHARNHALETQEKEWKKVGKCLKKTCGHQPDKEKHQEICRKRVRNFSLKLQGPKCAELEAVDFVLWQKVCSKIRIEMAKLMTHSASTATLVFELTFPKRQSVNLWGLTTSGWRETRLR